jgi:hypothetical protein
MKIWYPIKAMLLLIGLTACVLSDEVSVKGTIFIAALFIAANSDFNHNKDND